MAYQQELFDLMSTLATRFNKDGITLHQYKYQDSLESQNFRIQYMQIGSNNCKLIKGETYFVDCGSASVIEKMMFHLKIFPKWDPEAYPLRIEVDSIHRAPVHKLIHINAAGGVAIVVPQNEIEHANPSYPIDLVAISGTSTFINALNESLTKWDCNLNK